MEKEGLQTAVDFTKLLMALAGGGIALIIQPNFFAGNLLLKTLSVIALIFLSVCVLSGLIVFSGGSVMLAEKNYNLESPYVKIPGLFNVFSFGFGFVLLAIVIAIKVVSAYSRLSVALSSPYAQRA
jgi:TRAP-type C4-dicarboxylate transport system permease small subunit